MAIVLLYVVFTRRGKDVQDLSRAFFNHAPVHNIRRYDKRVAWGWLCFSSQCENAAYRQDQARLLVWMTVLGHFCSPLHFQKESIIFSPL